MRSRTQSLSRWYPEPWRERYRDELSALTEDDLGGRVMTSAAALWWGIVAGGPVVRG